MPHPLMQFDPFVLLYSYYGCFALKAKMMKSDSQDTKSQRKIQENNMSKNKNACFSCGLCQGSAGSIFESITEARNHVQTVHEIAEESVVDKLIKLPTTNFLKSYKCIACPGNAGWVQKSI